MGEERSAVTHASRNICGTCGCQRHQFECIRSTCQHIFVCTTLDFFPPTLSGCKTTVGDYMVGLLTSPFKGESLIFHASIAWSRVHEFIGDVSKQAISRMVHKLFHSVERGLGRKEKKKEKKKRFCCYFLLLFWNAMTSTRVHMVQ